MLSNCLFWALPRWLKNYLAGEALVIRRSKHTWIPHFMVTRCIKYLLVQEYIPLKYPKTKWLKWFPVQAIVFSGWERDGPADCMCEECREDTLER